MLHSILCIFSYCDNFVSDFALHGVKSVDMNKIEKDLKLSLKVRLIYIRY